MTDFIPLKLKSEDFEVEYELVPIINPDLEKTERQLKIINGTSTIDERLAEIDECILKYNRDINKLVNNTDTLDNAISVTSGVLTGLIDVFFVGEWNFKEAKDFTNREVNNKVVDFAKKQPDYDRYCNYALEGKGGPRRLPKNPDKLETAVNFLEWRFHLPGDGAYKTGKFGISGSSHRLDDLCHHPTLVGLLCCVLVQFSDDPKTKYVNSLGETIQLSISINEYGNFVGNNFFAKIFSGTINWFINCAKVIANRKGHLMSDMATSAGVPGSLVSIITELAEIPCFRDEQFLKKLRKAYINGIGTEKKQIDLKLFNALFEGANNKLDIRTEKAIVHELKRQAFPVVLNEILVRSFYFIRRFIKELKEKDSLEYIDWSSIIPLNNRTIVRMMTIASGTFMTVDLADAAIRSATKSVDGFTFASNMLLRVNFVGIGRFSIAVCFDLGMGIKKSIKTSERIKLQSEQIDLLNAKVYYSQADMWLAAESTGESINQIYGLIYDSKKIINDGFLEIVDSIDNIEKTSKQIAEKDPKLISEIIDVLKW